MNGQCATANTVEVEIWAENGSGGTSFKHRIRSGGGSWGQWGSDDIILPPESGAHDIIYRVSPESPKQVRFHRKPEHAIYVDAGTCPPRPGSKHAQIADVSVHPDCRTLTIHNRNEGEPVDLAYMLRFRGGFLGLGTDPYDPMIKNGGGTNVT